MKVLLHPDIYPVACKRLENWKNTKGTVVSALFSLISIADTGLPKRMNHSSN